MCRSDGRGEGGIGARHRDRKAGGIAFDTQRDAAEFRVMHGDGNRAGGFQPIARAGDGIDELIEADRLRCRRSGGCCGWRGRGGEGLLGLPERTGCFGNRQRGAVSGGERAISLDTELARGDTISGGRAGQRGERGRLRARGGLRGGIGRDCLGRGGRRRGFGCRLAFEHERGDGESGGVRGLHGGRSGFGRARRGGPWRGSGCGRAGRPGPRGGGGGRRQGQRGATGQG